MTCPDCRDKTECNCCFKWAVLAALHAGETKSKDLGNLKNYRRHANNYDWSMLSFPVDAKCPSVKEFEEANQLSLAIYGYDDDKEEVFSIKPPSTAEGRKEVDLLIFDNHFVYLRQINRLMFGLLSKQHNGSFSAATASPTSHRKNYSRSTSKNVRAVVKMHRRSSI